MGVACFWSSAYTLQLVSSSVFCFSLTYADCELPVLVGWKLNFVYVIFRAVAEVCTVDSLAQDLTLDVVAVEANSRKQMRHM